jgi:crotonobetainyl-CoA:carnitine CoA-transferase CaiB-like acyl-CoA transferase
VRTPITMSRTPLHYDRPSPRHGEHSGEVRAAIRAGKPAFRDTRPR